MRVRLLTSVVLIVTLSACFSATPPATSPTDSLSPNTGLAPNIFPHKSGWKDPTQHGAYVTDTLAMDATACLACHKEIESVSGGAPSCRSCHKNFPHTEPGVTFETHSDYILKNGKAACATQCHGTDLKGGLSGVACTQCHGGYPHPDGWSMPSAHGPSAVGTLKNNCAGCHGEDWNGGKSKVSCLSCHKGSFPHPGGWATPEQHGAFVSKNGTGKCATQCHGVQLDGGLSGKSCKDGCHKVWPHPATGWPALHGQTARSLGLSSCTGCHKNDATGGKTGVTCTKCHATFPAHQDADWKTSGHGKLVMQQPTSLTDPTGCPLCHGAALTGGKAPTLPGLKAVKGCNDSTCHATYPQLHKPAADAAAWNTYNGHGKWVMDQIKADANGNFANVLGTINDILTPCKLCHGSDLKGGNTGVGCYTSKCHSNFPHDMDAATTPWLSKHGAVAKAENPKAASCATANCHGQDLLGLPAGEKIVAKKWVKGCEDCHLKMPHLPLAEWKHGKSVTMEVETISKNGAKTKQTILDVSKCVTCHGGDWTGGTSKTSCYGDCHATFPQPHRDASGALSTTWKPITGHGKAVMDNYKSGSVKNTAATPCKVCHGSELTKVISGKTCYTCHKSFPHAAAPVVVGAITYTFTDAAWDGLSGFANSHGSYVVARAELGKVSSSQQAKTECGKTCHGTDLMGGTSGISCYKCHQSFPHAADWWKAFNPADAAPGGAHGAYVKTNGNTSCLKGCHTIDLPGGNSKTACATCHAAYPHVPQANLTWKDGHKNYIGQLAINKATTPFAIITSDCAPCHISAGPPAKNDCTSCHHQNAPDWKAKGKHDVAAVANIAGCKSCHGTDLKGTTIAPSCATCHGPETKAKLSSHQDVDTGKIVTVCMEENDMQECVNWADQKIFDYFVPKLHSDAAKVSIASCKICHGDDLKGGFSGQTCFVEGSCHDPGNRYKDHPAQKASWLQQMAAVPPQVETIAALGVKFPGGKMSYCTTACHNVLYPALNGGKKAFDDTLDCFGCHKQK